MTLSVSLNLSPQELERLREMSAHSGDPLWRKIEQAVAEAQAQLDLEGTLAGDLLAFQEERTEMGKEAVRLGRIVKKTGYTIEGLHTLRDFVKSYGKESDALGSAIEERHFDASIITQDLYPRFKRKLDETLDFFRRQTDAIRGARTSYLAEHQALPTARNDFSVAAKDALSASMDLLGMVGREDHAFGKMALDDAITMLMYGEGFYTGDREIVATLYRDTRGQPVVHFTSAMTAAAETLREEESVSWQQQRADTYKSRSPLRP